MVARKCCFFVDLRLGCIIIAGISLINPIGMLITDFMGPLYIFPLLVHLFLATVSVLLIIGIIEERRIYFYLYLILEGISLAVLVFYSVLAVLATLADAHDPSRPNQDEDHHQIIIGLIWSSISLSIYAYFYYIVYSYYTQLNVCDLEVPTPRSSQ